MRTTRRLTRALACAALIVGLVPAAARAEVETRVVIETTKPHKEKYETLLFLKENRAFIRARFDLLRQRLEARDMGPVAIDRRFLAYQQMLAVVRAADDSLAAIENARVRRELFASITELGTLESQLDQMDRMLAEQRGRLGTLQADFTGRQHTALAVVVSGYPAAGEVTALRVTLEDGAPRVVPISLAQRASLKAGGVLQVFQGLVEPREQVVELVVEGDGWTSGTTGYVTLEPARDRLQFLRLNLSTAQQAAGIGSVSASTWLLDASLQANGEIETRP